MEILVTLVAAEVEDGTSTEEVLLTTVMEVEAAAVAEIVVEGLIWAALGGRLEELEEVAETALPMQDLEETLVAEVGSVVIALMRLVGGLEALEAAEVVVEIRQTMEEAPAFLVEAGELAS